MEPVAKATDTLQGEGAEQDPNKVVGIGYILPCIRYIQKHLTEVVIPDLKCFQAMADEVLKSVEKRFGVNINSFIYSVIFRFENLKFCYRYETVNIVNYE